MIPNLICIIALIYGVCAIIISKLFWERAQEQHITPPPTLPLVLLIVATVAGIAIFTLIDFLGDVSAVLYSSAMLANFLASGYILSRLSSLWMKNKK